MRQEHRAQHVLVLRFDDCFKHEIVTMGQRGVQRYGAYPLFMIHETFQIPVTGVERPSVALDCHAGHSQLGTIMMVVKRM